MSHVELPRRNLLTLMSGLFFQSIFQSTNGCRADEKNDAANMVAALVSQNPPPMLVSKRGIDVPVFAEEFKWNDYQRVREAFFKVVRSERIDLWEELVRCSDDQRYSVTMRMAGPNALNFSVGQLCDMIARDRLILASHLHSNPFSKDHGDFYCDAEIGDLRKWRKERVGKSLHDLQVEICEKAIKTVNSSDALSDNAKSFYTQEIRKVVDEIAKSNKPMFRQLPWEVYEFFQQNK